MVFWKKSKRIALWLHSVRHPLSLVHVEAFDDVQNIEFIHFHIIGRSNVEVVTIGSWGTHCTCLKFDRNLRKCKHAIFVWTKVLGLDWHYGTCDAQVIRQIFHDADGKVPHLSKRLTARYLNGLVRDAVCYDELSLQEPRSLETCQVCHNGSHASCLKTFRQQMAGDEVATTCIHCRAAKWHRKPSKW